MENEIKIGNFKMNDWLAQSEDFSYRRISDNSFFLMLDPYETITEDGKLVYELKVNDRIKDKDGILLRVIDFGSAGLFGKDTFSWMWVAFAAENTKFGNRLIADEQN